MYGKERYSSFKTKIFWGVVIAIVVVWIFTPVVKKAINNMNRRAKEKIYAEFLEKDRLTNSDVYFAVAENYPDPKSTYDAFIGLEEWYEGASEKIDAWKKDYYTFLEEEDVHTDDVDNMFYRYDDEKDSRERILYKYLKKHLRQIIDNSGDSFTSRKEMIVKQLAGSYYNNGLYYCYNSYKCYNEDDLAEAFRLLTQDYEKTYDNIVMATVLGTVNDTDKIALSAHAAVKESDGWRYNREAVNAAMVVLKKIGRDDPTLREMYYDKYIKPYQYSSGNSSSSKSSSSKSSSSSSNKKYDDYKPSLDDQDVESYMYDYPDEFEDEDDAWDDLEDNPDEWE